MLTQHVHEGPPSDAAPLGVAERLGARVVADIIINVADHLFATGLCLPSGSSMTDADVDRDHGGAGHAG